MPSSPPASLAAFVDGHTPVTKELPFVHSTRCELFHHLCKAGFLSPSHCDVFGKPLLYFFYGRPAYRSKAGSLPNTDTALLPVCFVFKPAVLNGQMAQAFPFDSGAAHHGLFAPHIAPKNLPDFRLTPEMLSIKKAVSAFFETNEAYFAATAKPGFATAGPSGLPSLDGYRSLITEEGESHYDDRRAAIEVQTDKNVQLRDNLLTVILPTPFLGDPFVRDAITNEWRTYPLRYNHVRGTAPSEYVRTIVDLLRDFLGKGDYF
jgi:hypothetical protein